MGDQQKPNIAVFHRNSMQSKLAAVCRLLSSHDYVDFNIREYLEHNNACFKAELPFENKNNKEETCQGEFKTVDYFVDIYTR